MRRSERLSIISKILCENPNKIISLNHFANLLDAAKSSISEDLDIIKGAFIKIKKGEIVTISGAAGGVRYRPYWSFEGKKAFLQELCEKLNNPSRIIPGGFLYMTDIIFSPDYSAKIGEIFAQIFFEKEPSCILTVETKGIPLAMMTARAMNKPLVLARRNSKVTEGPSVNISYISGTGQRIQNMSLPKRALSENARVLIIDDFMKGGGTARGMEDLVREFGAEVVGIAVLTATTEPKEKLVADYTSLLVLDSIDAKNKVIKIKPDEEYMKIGHL